MRCSLLGQCGVAAKPPRTMHVSCLVRIRSGVELTPKDLVVPPSEGTGAPQGTSIGIQYSFKVGFIGGPSRSYDGPRLVESKIYKLGCCGPNLYLTLGRRPLCTPTCGHIAPTRRVHD